MERQRSGHDNLNTTMTKEKNPHDQGAKVSKALQTKYQANRDGVERRILARNAAGQSVEKLSADDWEAVLERVGEGAITAQVMRDFGVSPSTNNAKCKRDPAYKARYDEALRDGYWAIAEDIRNITRGIAEGSGVSVERDKLVAEYDYKIAKAIVPRLVDKQQIDQRSISITINKDDTEW